MILHLWWSEHFQKSHWYQSGGAFQTLVSGNLRMYLCLPLSCSLTASVTEKRTPHENGVPAQKLNWVPLEYKAVPTLNRMLSLAAADGNSQSPPQFGKDSPIVSYLDHRAVGDLHLGHRHKSSTNKRYEPCLSIRLRHPDDAHFHAICASWRGLLFHFKVIMHQLQYFSFILLHN